MKINTKKIDVNDFRFLYDINHIPKDKLLNFVVKRINIFEEPQIQNTKDLELIKQKISNLLLKYRTVDIIHFIKHNYSILFDESDKSNHGKYYTPLSLVNLLYEQIKSYISSEHIILDPAAGRGAFLSKFKDNKILAGDIDENAITFLKEVGYENVFCANFLNNLSREKYNINQNDKLIIIGNPPYNDTTSKNKRKIKADSECTFVDADIKSNDLGISFLKGYKKLDAEYICILHPFSYLIKETNFKNKLKDFIDKYKLIDGIIFSSHEFNDLNKTPFPIVSALYKFDANGMDYDFIKFFEFKIYKEKQKFILNNFKTIDGYIRKYPPKKNEKGVKSDIGLYMFNFRDTNSLLTSANFSEKQNSSTYITINEKDIYKYAYLNCYKRYFTKDFIFGNLSPIINVLEFEKNKYNKDVFLIDCIVNNQRLNCFNLKNKNNFLYENNYISEFTELSLDNNLENNCYKFIIDFINSKNNNKYFLKNEIQYYFENLKKTMLSGIIEDSNTKIEIPIRILFS